MKRGEIIKRAKRWTRKTDPFTSATADVERGYKKFQQKHGKTNTSGKLFIPPSEFQ